jgi:hypothetical protein
VCIAAGLAARDAREHLCRRTEPDACYGQGNVGDVADNV